MPRHVQLPPARRLLPLAAPRLPHDEQVRAPVLIQGKVEYAAREDAAPEVGVEAARVEDGAEGDAVCCDDGVGGVDEGGVEGDAGRVSWWAGKGEGGDILVCGHGVPLAASLELGGEVGDVGVAAELAALGVVVGGWVEVADGVGGLVGGMGGESGRPYDQKLGKDGSHFVELCT